ncbi:MAG TPA: exodeoxyribonuclease VII large subunit [Woeseiaceae bacterium]|nr:exodeoxyribonuclease VII large subunit [Woeseiaceae bacterium]
MQPIPQQIVAETAITVSELNRQARLLLEAGIARLWVQGEVSNLARPASGHFYFSLKDETAQIRCAWFRQRQRAPTHRLKDGDQVLALGRVSLYEARGDYQFIVDQVEPAGEGELQRRFEALKKKLAAEGLFDAARKRPLPLLPRRIGLITSPTGAAVRDILTVLRRRFPAIPVVIYPSPVQGDAAVPGLIAALEVAARRNECDVLIIGRGGGSLEDLWAFNEESLARAISACPIPIVSGVGHEIDVTIADFAADVRAPTPSGAAELVTPDQLEWQRAVDTLSARLAQQTRRRLENGFQALDWLSRRLNQCSPAARVRQQAARLKDLNKALAGAMRHDFTRRGRLLDHARARFLARSPIPRLERTSQRLVLVQARLSRFGTRTVERLHTRLRFAERALNSVSPLSTLTRGYAIVTDEATGRVLMNSEAIAPGQVVKARLARGSLRATVTETDQEPSSSAPPRK